MAQGQVKTLPPHLNRLRSCVGIFDRFRDGDSGGSAEPQSGSDVVHAKAVSNARAINDVRESSDASFRSARLEGTAGFQIGCTRELPLRILGKKIIPTEGRGED